jgi:hypothetical protein
VTSKNTALIGIELLEGGSIYLYVRVSCTPDRMQRVLTKALKGSFRTLPTVNPNAFAARLIYSLIASAGPNLREPVEMSPIPEESWRYEYRYAFTREAASSGVLVPHILIRKYDRNRTSILVCNEPLFRFARRRRRRTFTADAPQAPQQGYAPRTKQPRTGELIDRTAERKAELLRRKPG